MRTVTISLVIAALWIAGPRPAHADDKAAAEAEFVKAKKLKKEGRTADACAAFARSAALDPQHGTRYNLALCYQDLGKLASAWVIFRDLAQLDSNAARKKDSARRASALDGKLTKLLITTGAAPSGLQVTRDGADVTKVIGIEDPIDPGRYHIAARAPGYATWERDVEVAPGQSATITVEIPALERGTAPGPVTAPDPPRRSASTRAPGRGRRIAGLAIGGAGAVSLGIGLGFGAKARSTWREVVTLCGDDLSCPPGDDYARAQGLVDDTRSQGNLSTLLVGAGVAAIAAGVVLVVTAPHGDAERADPAALRVLPQVGGDGVGLVAAGVF